MFLLLGSIFSFGTSSTFSSRPFSSEVISAPIILQLIKQPTCKDGLQITTASNGSPSPPNVFIIYP